MDPKRLAEAADPEVLGRFLTSSSNIPGTAVPVRTYALFVIWHHKTMRTPVPPDGDSGTRNAAHRGPVFLPWHRLMLRFMELNLQRVLEDPTFGLPYWTGPSMAPQPPMVRLLPQLLADPGQAMDGRTGRLAGPPLRRRPDGP